MGRGRLQESSPTRIKSSIRIYSGGLVSIADVDEIPLKGSEMTERTTIILPVELPIGKRVEEVKKRIMDWALDLEEPFDEGSGMFRLVKIERQEKEYAYVYGIERGAIGRKRKI